MIGRKTRRNQPPRISPLCAALLLAFSSQPAQANPVGGVVASGQASFATSGNTLTVTNTPGTIINWQSFSIAASETTHFAQQSAASTVLNRIAPVLNGVATTGDPSSILGTLSSNGRVFLVNQYGIIFGKGATVDVAGLVATTLNLSDPDFQAGRYRFTNPSPAGGRAGVGVSNAGNISTQRGGQIYLIAPNVENTGVITAPNGEILLAAGHEVELVNSFDPNLRVSITAPASDATNVGKLIVESGSLGLFGTVVRSSGTASADSAVSQGGKIVFRASKNVILDTGSTTTASVLPSPSGGGAGGVGGIGGSITIEAQGAATIGGNVSADGARGGSIAVTAGGVSLAAEISARGTTGQGGSITIESQTTDLNNVHATLDVSGATGGTIREVAGHQITSSATYLATGNNGQGGNIDLTAPATKLLSAQIDASGATGGGQIRIGGEYQGGKSTASNPFGVSLSNPMSPLPNAETLAVSAGSVIKADATREGKGGTVILWSDLESALYPEVSAKGKNGSGGFIELSSAEKLLWGGTANAGAGGQVLMDPKNIVIQDAAAGNVQYNLTLGYNYVNLPRMKGNNLEANDFFGTGVSLSGTQLAVGAYLDDGSGNVATNSGAVYLFNTPFTAPALSGIIGKGYTGAGNYDLAALEAYDNFGHALSLSGTQLAVGAYMDDGSGNSVTDSGAVYLLNNPFTTPTLSGIIGKGYTGAGNYDVAALESFDSFGTSVSLSGTQLAVGAFGDDGSGNAAIESSAVYLFNNPFTTPTLSGILGKGYTGAGNFDVAALEAYDVFGRAVSLSGTQLAVGAYLDDGSGNAAMQSGAVYLFNNPFTTPTLTGIIGKGYTGAGNFDVVALEAGDRFGTSVSLSGTQLAVGAIRDGGSGNAAADSGAVYLFNDPFTAPALSGIIGKGYTGAGNFDVAALEAGDSFGISVSLSGTQLAVGAYADDDSGNAAADSGAVYLFNNPFTVPALSGIIGKGYSGVGNVDPGDALAAGDHFGSAVSLFGTQLAVGAMWDDGFGDAVSGSGAVYLFNDPYTTPTLSGIIGNGYTGAGNFNLTSLETDDRFGWSISLSGTQLAVGAWWDDGFGNAVFNSGAVYLFNNPFGATALSGIVGKGYIGTGNFDVAALQSDDQFGSAVSLSGTQLAVGAWWDDSFNNVGLNEGAVYLFNNPFGATALSGIIGNGYVGAGNVNLTLEVNDLFGTSVSLMGAQLAVGASGDDGFNNTANSSGAVYLFNNLDTTPTLSSTIGWGYVGTGDFNLTALGGGGLDAFGSAVSLSGTQLAVGAAGDDGFGNTVGNSGAVYLLNNPFGATALSGIIGKGYTGTGDHNLSVLEANDRFGTAISLSGMQLAVGSDWDDGLNNLTSSSGAVYLFTLVAGGGDPATGQTFASNSALDSTITPVSITAILNTGSALALQANNDITVNSAIAANNLSGNGGDLTLQAGRSILLNAGITTDNGNLNLIANDTVAHGVDTAYRDSGAAAINIASGVTLNAGTGAITMQMLGGGTGGDITWANAVNVTASSLTLQAINNILVNGSITALASPLNVVLNSDSDGAGGGAIVMNSGSSIASNGGNITMGGAPSVGYAIGNGTVTGGITFNSGIYVLGDITAGAGSITLRGQGFASWAEGVHVQRHVSAGGPVSIVSVGDVSTWDITVTGTGLANTNAIDVRATGWTYTGAMDAASGNISISGDAGVDLDADDWTPTISAQAGNVSISSSAGGVMATYWANVTGQNVSISAAGTVSDQENASNFGTITATTLNVTAGAGINLHTAVGSISTSNTGAGNTLINNTGALTVNGMTETSGSITLTNAGSVTVAGGVSANGAALSTTGVAIAANGAASDLGFTGAGGANTSSGAISLNAGQDIVHSGGAQQINTNSGTLTLTAGRDILHTGSTTNQINTFSGAMTLMAGRDIVHTDANQINSFSGAMLLDAGRDIVHSGAASQINNNSGSLTITAGQDFTHSASGQINTNSGALNITAGRDFFHSAGGQLNTSSGVMTIGVTGNFLYTGSGQINTASGAQAITVGGDLTVSGGSSQVSSSGGQTIAARDIFVGPAGGRLIAYSGAQNITAGRDMSAVMNGGSAFVESQSGLQTITVGGDLLVQVTNSAGGTEAHIEGGAGQVITVGGNLTMNALDNDQTRINANGGNQTITVGGNMTLNAAQDIAHVQSLSGTQAVTVAGNLTLLGSSAYMHGALGQALTVGGNLSLQSGVVNSGAATALQVGGDLTLAGGRVWSNGTLTGSVGRNVSITGELYTFTGLFGTPDIGSAANPFTVGGVIRMDDGSGAAQIHSGMAPSIWIHFPNLSGGGYFVNGVEGVVSGGSSGFFAGGVPAVLDSNLHITYRPLAIISQPVLDLIVTASVPPLDILPPPEKKRPDNTVLAGATPTQLDPADQPAPLPVCR